MKKIFLILAMLTGFAGIQAAEPTPNDEIATKLNARCPVNFNDGMLLNEVSVSDKNFIFLYQIPDDTFANMSQLGPILHDSLVAEMVSSPDKDIQQLLNICRQTGFSILQRFTDSTGKAFNITITPDDIK